MSDTFTAIASPSLFTSVSADDCTGYLYFWAHTQATYSLDRCSGICYPMPDPYDEWMKASTTLHEYYQSLEHTVRHHLTHVTKGTVRASDVSDVRDNPGTDSLEEEYSPIEVIACALYENVQWGRYIRSLKFGEQTESEQRYKAECRNRWVALEPKEELKAACIEAAEEQWVSCVLRIEPLKIGKAKECGQGDFSDKAFDLNAELDRWDELGLRD